MTMPTLKQISVTGGTRPYRYIPNYNQAFTSPTWPTGTNQNTNVADWTMNGPGWVGADTILTPTDAAKITDAQSTTYFDQWYKDDATVNMTFTGTISLSAVNGQPGTVVWFARDNGKVTMHVGTSRLRDMPFVRI